MERISMSKEEIKRYKVISQVLEKKIPQRRAAELLNLSLSRVKALCARVRKFGAQGVVHGNAGRKPSHAIREEVRVEMIDLYHSKYRGFNFSHFQEKLAENHQIVVSVPTVHRTLTSSGVISPRKHRKRKHHYRRTLKRERESGSK